MNLLDELGTRVVCGDGAIGTLLLEQGVPLERCFEELCVSEPERVQAIHHDYISAGARLIQTNTFGANAVRLARFGFEKRATEINRAAVEVARAAVCHRDVFVAGSVGPLGITVGEAVARSIDQEQCFREQISALLEAGVDLIFFETFTEFAEMEIALRAKNAVGLASAICSFACKKDGKLHDGMLLTDAFARLRDQGATIMGVNCLNDPQEMIALLDLLPAEYLLAVYPAAGQPQPGDGAVTYEVTSEQFAGSVRELVARGARLLGGCCGTTPQHICALAKAIGDSQSR
jgi:methionine synthase / methylenetetrahydrofolate reductase(NADPH)